MTLVPVLAFFFFFFFNDTATTEIYTLSLHDALPISALARPMGRDRVGADHSRGRGHRRLGARGAPAGAALPRPAPDPADRRGRVARPGRRVARHGWGAPPPRPDRRRGGHRARRTRAGAARHRDRHRTRAAAVAGCARSEEPT